MTNQTTSLRVDDVIITEELDRRPSREPDHAKENDALRELAETMASAPDKVLGRLAEVAMALTGSDSAGISLLEPGGERDQFHWVAATGGFAPLLGGKMDRAVTPCGEVLDRNHLLLFAEPHRVFPSPHEQVPDAYETLLAPFHIDGKAAGTVWAIKHSAEGRFEREDGRLLLSLSGFAAAAHQMVQSLCTARQAGRDSNTELRHRAEQFETLTNQAPIGVYLVDADFRIAQVNAVAQPVFGDISDLIGRDFDEVIHILWEKSYADELCALFRHTLETGEPYDTPERSQFRADRGVIEYYSWRIDRITLPDGRFGVVCYFSDISEQVRARLAIAESEKRYRSLFDTMGQGCSVVEVVRDAQGEAIDYRLIELNPAFERITGISREQAVGRLSAELFGSVQPDWLAAFDRVVRSGRPEHVEARMEAIGRWIETSLYPAGPDRFITLYDDVTERKRAEAALRESEERQAFLLKLSDALRPLIDAADIQGEATRLLREHFDVGWCYYLDYNDDLTEGIVLKDSHRAGLPSLAGTHDVSDVPKFIEHCKSGQILNMPRWTESPLWSQRAIEQYRIMGFQSLLGAPLLKQGQLRAMLLMIDTTQRDWTENALILIDEVAERTWAAVERARAEAALRAAEESHRAIFTGTSAGFVVLAPDAPRFTIMDVNDAYLNMTTTRREDLIGRPLFEAFPENPDDPEATNVRDLRASLDRVLATKRRDVLPRLKYDIPKPGGGFEERWWDPIQTPLLGPDGAVTAIIHHATEQTNVERAEAALRESKEQQAFLLHLSDALRPLTDAIEIQKTASRLLGEHLGASRTTYAELEGEGDERVCVLRGQYVREGAPFPDRVRYDDFTRGFAKETLLGGEPLIVSDVASDPRVEDVREAWFSAGIQAVIAVPLLKHGREVAILGVHQSQPRAWTSPEVELVRETLDRTWDAVHRARAEAALRESEERFRLIVESARDYAIFMTDPEDRITQWLPGAEAVFGWSRDEAIGRPAGITYTPEDRADGVPEDEIRTAAREGSAPDVRWHQRKDGSKVFMEGSVTPLRNSDGSIRGFVKIGQDVTERRHALELLEASERRMRSLATGIPQLVFRSTGEGYRTWGSPQWIEYTALSFEESVGFGWLERVHPDDRELTRAAWEGVEEEGEYYCEHRIWHSASDAYRWHQTRAAPSCDEEGRIVEWLGTSTDVEELRTLQRHTQTLLAELQHRVRNTLGIVRSITRRTAASSHSVEEMAMHLEGRVGAFSRVQAAVTRNPEAGVDLASIVAEELLAHAAREGEGLKIKGPNISFQPRAAESVSLAIHELATNSVKYGALSAEYGRVNIGWERLASDDGEMLRLVWEEYGLDLEPGEPERKGFGFELLERTLPYDLDAETEVEFRPEGLHFRMTMPLTDEVLRS